jgi:hypothetical protein
MYVAAAIWKSYGIPAPNIIVMKVTFIKPEYLKCMKYFGPDIRLTYCWIEVFLVDLSSSVKAPSLSLNADLMPYQRISLAIGKKILNLIEPMIVAPILSNHIESKSEIDPWKKTPNGKP